MATAVVVVLSGGSSRAAAAKAHDQPIIGGQGEFRFLFRPDLVQLPLPEKADDQNGHGLIVDRTTKSFYFTWQPKKVGPDTHALARFTPDGKTGTLLGKPGPEGLGNGVPHGLRIEHDAVRGQTFLYHANNAQRVTKTTIDGTIVWSVSFADWQTTKPQYWPIIPTDAIVVPGTDLLLLADGYGSSFIHFLNKTTGEYLPGRTFGGGQGQRHGAHATLQHAAHGCIRSDDPAAAGTGGRTRLCRLRPLQQPPRVGAVRRDLGAHRGRAVVRAAPVQR